MVIYQPPYQGSYRVTCIFGKLGSWAASFHIGVDLVGEDKKVQAIGLGVVISINNKGKAYGNHVLVGHPDGKVSLYAHLDRVNVTLNQKVTPDTVLGIEGSTGNVTGRHLHLEIHEGGYRYPPRNSKLVNCPWLVDPIRLFKECAEKMAELEKAAEEKKAAVPQWQKDACKNVCEQKAFSNEPYWQSKVANGEVATWGEVFGVLARFL